jgi:hypothetical protein
MQQTGTASQTPQISQSNSILISPTTSSPIASSTLSLTITQPPFVTGPSVISGSVSGAQSTKANSSHSVTSRSQYLLGWTISMFMVIAIVIMAL